MGEDDWLEAAYEDAQAPSLDEFWGPEQDDPCSVGDHALDDDWQCEDCGADLST